MSSSANPPAPASGNDFSSLRTEIVESEKARIDLLKYKLVAIAALGAAGLGLGSGSDPSHAGGHPLYVLCIIPLACLYVDLLCWHNTLRILVIAKFLKGRNDPYENFVAQLGKGSFDMEDWALHCSTIAISAALGIWGLVELGKVLRALIRTGAPMRAGLLTTGLVFFVTGALGVFLSLFMESRYRRRETELRVRADDTIADNKGA
jgi:hypothetical protein